jgi:hypothetical protein
MTLMMTGAALPNSSQITDYFLERDGAPFVVATCSFVDNHTLFPSYLPFGYNKDS